MKKIFVINNDIETMTLLSTWLKSKGYEATFNGREEDIEKLVDSFKPDLIIADILHYSAVELLKSHTTTAHIPVLLMTGYTKGAGKPMPHADDTIEKPFDFPLFESKIAALLDKPNKLTA